MTRRKIYSKVEKVNQNRPDYVNGQIVYIGYYCLNPECKAFNFIKESELDKPSFAFKCNHCGYQYSNFGYEDFFDYQVVVKDNLDVPNEDELDTNEKSTYSTIESGKFRVQHRDYLNRCERFKYCLNCYTLQPLSNFDKHSGLKSGHQGECQMCKKMYNGIKNQTRTADQFAESAQKRRLFEELAGSKKINRNIIFRNFNNKCFNCGANLLSESQHPHLDHTLPVKYLWPLESETATLLCSKCNLSKADKWPSQFYTSNQLKMLSVITGVKLSILEGEPIINPNSLQLLHNPCVVDNLLTKYAKYMDEIITIRNRVFTMTHFDFFNSAHFISPTWVNKANSLL